MMPPNLIVSGLWLGAQVLLLVLIVARPTPRVRGVAVAALMLLAGGPLLTVAPGARLPALVLLLSALLVGRFAARRLERGNVIRALKKLEAVVYAVDSSAALDRALGAVAEHTGLRAALALRDPDTQMLCLAHLTLPPRQQAVVGRAIGETLHGLELPARARSLVPDDGPQPLQDATRTLVDLLPPGAAHLAAPIAARLGLDSAALVPLEHGQQSLGLLVLSHPAINSAPRSQLAAAAAAVAVAADRARQQAKAAARADQVALLAETARQLANSADLETLAAFITHRIRRLFPQADVSGLYVRLEQNTRLRLASADGLTDEQRRAAEETAWERHPGWVVRNQRPLLCSDSEHDPRVLYLAPGPRHRALMHAPLLVEGGRCVGTVSAAARAPYAFNASDMELLLLLADQVAMAVSGTLLMEEAKRRAEQLEQTSVAGQQLAATVDIDNLLTLSTRTVCQLLDLSHASLYLFDRPGERPSVSAAAHHPDGEELCAVDAGSPLWQREDHRPLAVPDLREASELPLADLSLIRRGVRSLIVMPIVHDAQIIGGLIGYATQARRVFDRVDRELARVLAGQIAVAVQNARQYAATLANKERTEAIVRSSLAGIVTLDPEGCVRQINPAARTLLGVTADAALGQPIDALLGRTLWEDPEGPLHALLSLGEVIEPIELQIPGEAGDRPQRDIQLGVAPLSDGFVLSLADITRLKELDRLKTELLANVSHELRTPLATIKAYIELLRDDVIADPAEQHDVLDVIDSEADRLSQCIGNLLDLARIEAGSFQLKTEWVQLSDLVTEALQMTASRIEDKDARIEIDHTHDDLALVADRAVLTTMLKNLLDNAIKFGPQRGRVRVSSHRDAEGLHIAIEDSGPGIPPEDIPKIFEKFYRVESSTQSGIDGSGLGLVIARRAARAHGGEITVASGHERGGGSTFTAHLPLRLLDPQARKHGHVDTTTLTTA